MAILLPFAKQQFADANGAPLSLGTVTLYVPGTTTLKDSWQDAAQTQLNTNPIALDIGGYATIYGNGAYRQLVKDRLGNVIWDRVVDTSYSSGPAGSVGPTGSTGPAGPAGATSYSRTLSGIGAPAATYGATNDTYLDVAANTLYGPKTAAGWGTGTALAIINATPAFNVTDFRAGALPSGMTLTRAQASTDAFFDDAPGRTYNTIAAGQPHFRNDKGLGVFSQSKNYLLNSTAPAAQTVTLAAGTYVLWGNGTGTLTSAVGTAVGTGLGALDLTLQSFQKFTLTTGGTVTVTKTGNCNYFQLENQGVPAPNNASPTPLIVTTSTAVTRDADQLVASGSLLSFFQGTAGTAIFDVMQVRPAGTNALFYATNGNAEMGAQGDTTFIYWDGASFFQQPSTADGHFTKRIRAGFAWSTAGVSAGAGTKLPVTSTTALPSPTAVYFGQSAGGTQGNDNLNGWIVRLETLTQRLSDLDLWKAYTSLRPLGNEIVGNIAPLVKLGRWRRARQAVVDGTADTILVCMGTSHTAGAAGVTIQQAWPYQLAARLNVAGIPASAEHWFGVNGTVPATGTPAYDTRKTYSANWSNWGNQLGTTAMRTTTAGSTFDFAAGGTTDLVRVWYYTNEVCSFTISANGGGTLATVNNASAVSGLTSIEVNLTRGTNSIRVTAVSGAVVLAGMVMRDSLTPKVLVINGGAPGNTAANLAKDNGAEDSWGLCIRSLAPSLTLYECVTNDASGATATASYSASVGTALDNALTVGDVIVATDPPTLTSTISLAAQDTYTTLELAEAAKRNLPVVDVHNGMLGDYAKWNRAGFYGDGIHFTANGHAIEADVVSLAVLA